MRILVALGGTPYSAPVIREAAKLAYNTWADVTLLAVGPQTSGAGKTPDPRLAGELSTYKEDFLRRIRDEEALYPSGATECAWEKTGPWAWEQICKGAVGRKDLKLRIRQGVAGKLILEEAKKMGSDLILLACGKGTGCAWEGDSGAAARVVSSAPCSVLAVKEEKDPSMIVCCLDNANVSQESLELINQLVTIHHAELGIVGLTEAKGIKSEVDREMAQVLKYYSDRNVRAWVKMVETSVFADFVDESAEKDLVALWMGRPSLLDKIFSRQRLGKLVSSTRSSILILR
ncbi:MAG: universal stress protein [Proteobacteria bacterium]|nr:universal stress protein [Pseudomonadota bacterium]